MCGGFSTFGSLERKRPRVSGKRSRGKEGNKTLLDAVVGERGRALTRRDGERLSFFVDSILRGKAAALDATGGESLLA